MASLCGSGLGVGQGCDYSLRSGQPGAPGALLISLPNRANLTLFAAANPGTVVSGTGLVLGVPIVLDGVGELALPVPGVATQLDLVFQSLTLDTGVLPHNVAFSNAVLASFGT